MATGAAWRLPARVASSLNQILSGQVGVDAQKRLAGGGGFEAQAERAFENLGTALALPIMG